jgi:hypothetical protein
MTYALFDLQAVFLFQENRLEEALRAYQEIPRTQWDDFGKFDPFRATIHDCLECPHSKDTSDLYNRGQLITELIELEYKARAEPEKAARNNFLLGVAFYNMTFFGHSWKAMDHFRSAANWDRLSPDKTVFPYLDAPFGNKEVANVERPLYYFDKARLLAQSRELQAKATYMAAKCEHLLYYMHPDFKKPCCNIIPTIPPEYSTNFERLKEEYSDTDFYEDIIRECQYFRVYALK